MDPSLSEMTRLGDDVPKISILKRVDSILVPRGVCRLLIGCTVIVKIVRYDYDMTVLWI
jgi:hypothetical protein